MNRLRSALCLPLLGAALLLVAMPATAAAESRLKPCSGIGETITKLRAKGLDCDSARTLSAKWAETVAGGASRVVTIDDFRCVRSNPRGPGWAVRCAKRGGPEIVTFRADLS